jgi:hypothetical protein
MPDSIERIMAVLHNRMETRQERFQSVSKKFIIKLLLAATCFTGGLSATTRLVQVQSLSGGFVAGCSTAGCGGSFLGMLGGDAGADGNLENGVLKYLYCVDFQNDVYIPSRVYAANLTTLTNGADMSNTLYGRTDAQWAPGDAAKPIVFTNATFQIDATHSLTPASALQRYQMAAWLISQYSLPNANRNAIQYAIWQALAVNAPAGEPANKFPKLNAKTTAAVNDLLAAAADFVKNDYSDAFFSHYHVVTQVAPLYLHGPNQIQEFIVANPEPALLAVPMAGIFGWLMLAKRRKTRREQTAGSPANA